MTELHPRDPWRGGNPNLPADDRQFLEELLGADSKVRDKHFIDGTFLRELSRTEWMKAIGNLKGADYGKWIYDNIFDDKNASSKVYLKMKLEELFVAFSIPIHNKINSRGCMKLASTYTTMVSVLSALQRVMAEFL